MGRERTKQIVIRMTEHEHQQIKRQVERSGMRQQDFLIKALTEKHIVSTDGITELMPELKRIGNNLNQLARRTNEGHFPATAEEVKKIGMELSDVWQLLRQLARGHLLDEQSHM